MPIYITAQGVYAVEHKRYILATFTSLKDATAFCRQQNKQPIYTWFN